MSSRTIYTCDQCGKRRRDGRPDDWLRLTVSGFTSRSLLDFGRVSAANADLCSIACAQAILLDEAFITKIEEERI